MKVSVVTCDRCGQRVEDGGLLVVAKATNGKRRVNGNGKPTPTVDLCGGCIEALSSWLAPTKSAATV